VKKNWTVEQNTGPAMIFGESNNREVEIPALKKVYGVVTLKDFYTKSSNAFIGILGQGEKPCIVPVEIHPNKITVSRCKLISRYMMPSCWIYHKKSNLMQNERMAMSCSDT